MCCRTWYKTESPRPYARYSQSPAGVPSARNSAPQNAVRDVLSHLVQNGVTDAAVVETRLTAAEGDNFDADVVYFDSSSRARVILEVSIDTIGSDTSLGSGA